MGKKTNLKTAQNNHIFFGKGGKMYKRISFMLAAALVLGLAGSASAAYISVSWPGPANIPDMGVRSISLQASGAPAGATITDVKYRLKVDDRGDPSNFWCSDYEIHLSNDTHGGSTKYKTCWNNYGGKTDEGRDDDAANDSDIFLNWRSTNAFNGENPNQRWYVRIEDNETNHFLFWDDGLGRVDYVQFRIYYNVPLPELYDDGEGYRSFSPQQVTEGRPGQSFNIHCRVRNGGTVTVPLFGVRFYASTDTTISAGDRVIGERGYFAPTGPGGYASISWNGVFPTNIPAGRYWIGWIIDPGNDVSESNENNNTAYKVGYKLTVLPANSPPIASFTYSPANPVVGEEITFDASDSEDPDGTIEHYQWQWGDGSSGGSRTGTRTHTYSESGEYTVTLTVKDNDGLENSEPERRNVIVSKRTLTIIYVDDDSPNDPVPYDPAYSDRNENGTPEHPFDMIQEGIDAALDGETVFVRDGTYWEAIEFAGRNITVTGFDPNEPNAILPYPMIDANYIGTAVTFRNEEEPNCILEGFVITRGAGDIAGGINCVGSSPTISDCLIVGNRVTHPDGGGGAAYCIDSNAVFENCTFSGNYGGEQGAGLLIYDSNVVLLNSILWDNGREVYVTSGPVPVTSYCDVQGGIGGRWGADNMIEPPLFAEPGYWVRIDAPNVQAEPSDLNTIWIDGDYHLKSQAGRWEPYSASWVADDFTSPCIDAGDPNSSIGEEPKPNGGIINMGAYGGTPQASMSLSTVAAPLSEALDTPLSFTTGGSADWFSQTTTSHYDGDAAQSGDISHDQESWMQTTVSGKGTVKFYWKVSSEDYYDFLEFYIDGSLQNHISGSVNWQQKTYTIGTSGSHMLEWRYVKDKGTGSGSDCGWVDKVEWITTP